MERQDLRGLLNELAQRLGADQRMSAGFLLWTATGDRAHLEKAKRLLDEALESVPEEYRPSARQNLRVNREILAAWRAEFRGGDDGPSGSTESVTWAGLSGLRLGGFPRSGLSRVESVM